MGIFGFFSKDKKEKLDKGLEKTKVSVFEKLSRAVGGKSKIDEASLDDIEEALITSDIGVETSLKIIERLEERVTNDKYVDANELTAILKDEIGRLLEESHNTNETW
jgi:fused signal recognition particle receptor